MNLFVIKSSFGHVISWRKRAILNAKEKNSHLGLSFEETVFLKLWKMRMRASSSHSSWGAFLKSQQQHLSQILRNT